MENDLSAFVKFFRTFEHEENDPLASTNIFRTFEYELSLMEKQIRMLREIADSAAVVQPEGKFVIVHQAQMKELVQLLELEIGVMQAGLSRRVA